MYKEFTKLDLGVLFVCTGFSR